jgi:rod shape-determining protein MreD
MSSVRVLNTSLFLFLVFLIQTTLIARINFPIGGFSLYIATLMVVLSLEDRTGSLVFGFIGGLVMDLSPSAQTPFGQWALAMTFIGYLFSVNRESVGDFNDRPLALTSLVSFAASVSLFTFIVIGVLLGQNNGGFLRNLSVIFTNFIWTFLITPIFMPLILRVRKMLLTNRERI